MGVQLNFRTNSGCQSQSACPDAFGCPRGVCPDFVIRRHDTKPAFKVYVEDCDGAIDLRGLVAEASMWALARLKKAITAEDEYFRLADDIGFEQIMVGDVIVMDRVRRPEHMLVIGFDETNKLVKVERGYRGTEPSEWKKGTRIRIFRFMNAPAQTEMVFEDIEQTDGTTEEDVLTESFLVYEWDAADTCLPGCYWFEFKLIKLTNLALFLPGGIWTGEVHEHSDGFFYTGTSHTDSSVRLSYNSVEDHYEIPTTRWEGEYFTEDDNHFTGTSHDDGSVILNRNGVPSDSSTEYNSESTSVGMLAASIIPSFTDPSLTAEDFGCSLLDGVEWIRRFPVSGEGFLVKIEFSPTTEL